MTVTTLANAVKIGVLIPTCNRMHFLRKSLQSAIGQRHGNMEIIVIDNAATGGVGEYVSRLADSRVRYVANETDLGLIGSIRKGIGLMDGDIDWCTILCDDDFLDEDFLSSALSAAREHSAKAVVHGHRIFVDVAGERIRDALAAPIEESAVDYITSRSRALRETYLSGIFFRRRVFDEIGGYPKFATGMASDDAFLFALSLKDRLLYCRKAVAFIRLHEGAESRICDETSGILQTVIEFETYCLEKAFASGRIHPDHFGALRQLLRAYAVRINSNCLLQRIYQTMKRDEVAQRRLIEDLCRIVTANSPYFSLRTRFDAACARHLKRLPESSRLYRGVSITVANTRTAIRNRFLATKPKSS